jgi:hypothetical protein
MDVAGKEPLEASAVQLTRHNSHPEPRLRLWPMKKQFKTGCRLQAKHHLPAGPHRQILAFSNPQMSLKSTFDSNAR